MAILPKLTCDTADKFVSQQSVAKETNVRGFSSSVGQIIYTTTRPVQLPGIYHSEKSLKCKEISRKKITSPIATETIPLF